MTPHTRRLFISSFVLICLLAGSFTTSMAETDQAGEVFGRHEGNVSTGSSLRVVNNIVRTIVQELLVSLPEPDGAGRDAYYLTEMDGKEPATDSASAATAMATGHKTDAGNIAWASGDLEGGELETVAEQLRADKGYAIGVVSTVPFNHATPASFVSHDVNRGNKAEIAQEIIFDTAPELVIGGGFDNSYFPLDSSAYISLTSGLSPYASHVVTRQTGVDGALALESMAAMVTLSEGHKLFGLFGSPGGNFEYHDVADDPGHPAVTRGAIEDPTLTDATEVALELLSQDEDGFFVMFEQGDIDWSNHANNFATMVGGIWDLDQAVRAAEDFVAQSDQMDWSNTLMILTSDHSNSYMRNRLALGMGDLPLQVGSDYAWDYPDGEVTYATTNHTNELVTVWARGEGTDLFRDYAGLWYRNREIVDNTHLYDVMWRAADEAGAKYVILFIGDGMNIEHEIAGSRYLYGEDMGLAWHDWDQLADGWSGYCTTWDVDTYNKYAGVQGADPYDLADFEPTVGYDPDMGGAAPFPLQPYVRQFSEYVPGTLSHVSAEGHTTTIEVPEEAVTDTDTLTLIYAPWEAGTPPEGLAFAGEAFDLDIYDDGEKLEGYTFQSPITLTIVYTGTALNDVALYRWHEDAWTEVNGTNFGPPERSESCNWDADSSTLRCSLWQLSSFAPLESKEVMIYLPLLLN